MNCFGKKKWWTLTCMQSIQYWICGLENWNLELWEKNIAKLVLKWVIFSLSEYFQKPRITVIGSSHWQVSDYILVFSELFEERRYRLCWSHEFLGKGGYGYLQKREFQRKRKSNQRKRNSQSHTSQNVNGISLSIGQMWLQFWKAVCKISVWLAKKTSFITHYSLICLVYR